MYFLIKWRKCELKHRKHQKVLKHVRVFLNNFWNFMMFCKQCIRKRCTIEVWIQRFEKYWPMMYHYWCKRWKVNHYFIDESCIIWCSFDVPRSTYVHSSANLWRDFYREFSGATFLHYIPLKNMSKRHRKTPICFWVPNFDHEKTFFEINFRVFLFPHEFALGKWHWNLRRFSKYLLWSKNIVPPLVPKPEEEMTISRIQHL